MVARGGSERLGRTSNERLKQSVSALATGDSGQQVATLRRPTITTRARLSSHGAVVDRLLIVAH